MGEGVDSESEDEGWLSALVAECDRGVRRFVELKLGRNASEVDQVCSDVRELARERSLELHHKSDREVRAWLLGVAGNLCQHVLRSRVSAQRRDRRFFSLVEVVESEPFDDEVLARFAGDTTTLVERVQGLVLGMSELDREVLSLDSRGCGGREIAAELRITEGAARVRLMRARQRFAALYRERFGSPFDGGGTSDGAN